MKITTIYKIDWQVSHELKKIIKITKIKENHENYRFLMRLDLMYFN